MAKHHVECPCCDRTEELENELAEARGMLAHYQHVNRELLALASSATRLAFGMSLCGDDSEVN